MGHWRCGMLSSSTLDLSTLNRRRFCGLGAAAVVWAAIRSPAWGLAAEVAGGGDDGFRLVAETDRQRILSAADSYLALEPATITSFPSGKSPGGPHDYF